MRRLNPRNLRSAQPLTPLPSLTSPEERLSTSSRLESLRRLLPRQHIKPTKRNRPLQPLRLYVPIA